MANQCAICGADINLIQTQKLSDGNCICRKNCRKRASRYMTMCIAIFRVSRRILHRWSAAPSCGTTISFRGRKQG